MEIALTAAYSALFIFLIGKWKFFRLHEIPVSFIKSGFILKLLAGISLGLIYTFYYTDRCTADTYKFFDDSKVLYDAFFTSKSDFFRILTGINAGSNDLIAYYNTMNNWYDVYSPFNDNRTMIRFNAILRFLSFGYYYVHVVFICFLSLTGIVAIVKVLQKTYPHLAGEFLFILICTPSVLFWGSGLLKDSLVYFSLGITLFTFSSIIDSGAGAKKILLFVLSLALLMITKFQVFLLIIPLIVAWGLSMKLKTKPLFIYGLVSAAFVLLLIIPGTINSRFDLPLLLAQKQNSFINLAETTQAGSIMQIPQLEPSLFSVLWHAPSGFLNALLRPNLLDGGGALNLIAGIENTIILIFGIWCLLRTKFRTVKNEPLLWFCIFYVVSSFTLTGTITPVLGALVRYKAQALPFLVIIFVIVSSQNQESQLKIVFNKFLPSKWK